MRQYQKLFAALTLAASLFCGGKAVAQSVQTAPPQVAIITPVPDSPSLLELLLTFSPTATSEYLLTLPTFQRQAFITCASNLRLNPSVITERTTTQSLEYCEDFARVVERTRNSLK